MCGIVAIYSDKKSVSAESLRQAVDRLQHRGPDAQRVWIGLHGRVGLGHSRLSIIDLKTGDQPIANEDEGVRIVVGGEFYGFKAIREELEDKGHRFRTRSDSEIAVHLYEEYGTQCLSYLRGEFAFVLWDNNNRLLFAARDRFGIKPLFYAVHEDSLYLASEVKALFAAGVPARWDRETVFDLLSASAHVPDRTLYEGIHEVPPGHMLLASGRNLRLLPYWDFNYPRAELNAAHANPLECAALLREKLYEAVRLRLCADVPVSCYLSGGLDSSAILGIAATQAAHPLRAYTLSFDHPDYDERAIAQEMAAHAGAEFCPVEINSVQLAENFADAVWHAERPFLNPHGVAKYLLSRAVRDNGDKVVLTGEGADELFAGYSHFRRDMVLRNMQPRGQEHAERSLASLESENQMSQGILTMGGGKIALPNVSKALGFVPSFLEVWALGGRALRYFLDAEFAAAYAGRDTYQVIFNHLDLSRQLRQREPVHQSLYLWSKTALPNYILSSLGDRMEMAHSVEGRLPFLDHELVELVAQMPISVKIHEMTEKYVLREAARPVLTEMVYQRQKHPFLSPPSVLRPDTALFRFIADTLRGKRLADTGIFDQRKVIWFLDKLPEIDPAARARFDPMLMIITSMCVLQERFTLA